MCQEEFTQAYITTCAEQSGIQRFKMNEMLAEAKLSELDPQLSRRSQYTQDL